MRGHADAETLAAFREDLLSRRKAGRVSAHLAACPRCAALDAQLAEVTALLTSTTAPPVPDTLTARIEAALAAEAAARSGQAARSGAGVPRSAAPADTVPAGAADGRGTGASGAGGRRGARGRGGARGTGGRGPSRHAPGRSRLALRAAAVAAAVAVVAGGGYGVARLLSPGSPAATGTAGPAAPPAARNPVTLPSMSARAGGVGAPAAGEHTSSNGTAAPRLLSSGTNYQPGRLGAQAAAVLTQVERTARGAASPGPLAAPLNSSTGLFPGLQFCLALVAPGQRPLLIDVARYHSHPAAIIVLPATAHAPIRALAVAPGCTATTAHVLATAPLPNPR